MPKDTLGHLDPEFQENIRLQNAIKSAEALFSTHPADCKIFTAAYDNLTLSTNQLPVEDPKYRQVLKAVSSLSQRHRSAFEAANPGLEHFPGCVFNRIKGIFGPFDEIH